MRPCPNFSFLSFGNPIGMFELDFFCCWVSRCAEVCEELDEEVPPYVLAHLVEHEPVPQGPLVEVADDLLLLPDVRTE